MGGDTVCPQFHSACKAKHFFWEEGQLEILPLHIHPARHAPCDYALVIKIHLQGLSRLLHSGAGAAVCAQVRMKPSVFPGALYHHLRSRRLLKAVINDEETSVQYTLEVCGGLEERFTVEDLETEFTLLSLRRYF